MTDRPLALFLLASIVLGACWASVSEARPLRVVTSFPPSMIDVYRRAFQAAHPGIEVEFIQRKTTAAVAELAAGDRLDADLFWASAPDAFELLKLQGHLARLAPRATGAPAAVAGYPVNDPDGQYLGFALSAYGLVWNEAYLARHRLPVPRGWQDLVAPIYAGHVGISSPSRSGTTHLVVEALLQSEGWERGWTTWRQIGGNLATVTARSFGVSAGVARGRFGIGVTIDFLAQPAGLDAEPVRFSAPDPEIFAPASIALLRRAQNIRDAEIFVDFVLSVAGQRLLLDPAIGRQPIRSEFYTEGRSEGPDPFQTLDDATNRRFNAGRSAERYELINLMFDELITFRLAETSAIWRTVNEVDASLLQAPDDAAAKAATQARALLGVVPFSEEEAMRIVMETPLVRVPRGLQPPVAQAKLMTRLRDWADDNLAAARLAAANARARLVALARLPEAVAGSVAP